MSYKRHVKRLDVLDLKQRNKVIIDASINIKDFFFIEIGANDGILYDQMHPLIIKYNLTGLLVEPLPGAFKKLKDNYKKIKNLKFEMSAVGLENKQTTFYKCKKDVCSSLIKDNINLKSKGFTEIQVQMITIKKLLEKHSIEKVDLFHIDTEGYDYILIGEILKLDKKPKIIEFEMNILTTEKNIKECFENLKNNGYDIYHLTYKYSGWDCMAILK